ncbi:MAG: VanZ family protein [Rothia sp. (in: high G+C Gram-positive bacteria)]|nr:VanZ family protein [Rothia sp. (in: high G+C Gram-positive bacteria)]
MAALFRPSLAASSLLWWAVTGLYLLLVGLIVFWPQHVDAGQSGQTLARLLAQAHAAGYLPGWFGYGQVEWLSNLLMFIPGGFFFTYLLLPTYRWLVPLGGLAATCLIESVQHFMPGRTSSALDLLANSLGCVIGWVFALILLRIREKPKTKPDIRPSF